MHASQQFVLIYGLVEEVISTAHDPVNAVGVTVQTGEQYDRSQTGFRLGLHRLTNFKSGWAGHHHVQQGEINRIAIHSSYCLLAVRCTNDLVTLCAQQSGEQFAVGFVVIGNKDGFMMALWSRHIASLTILSTAQEGSPASTLVERWNRIYPAQATNSHRMRPIRKYLKFARASCSLPT